MWYQVFQESHAIALWLDLHCFWHTPQGTRYIWPVLEWQSPDSSIRNWLSENYSSSVNKGLCKDKTTNTRIWRRCVGPTIVLGSRGRCGYTVLLVIVLTARLPVGEVVLLLLLLWDVKTKIQKYQLADKWVCRFQCGGGLDTYSLAVCSFLVSWIG